VKWDLISLLLIQESLFETGREEVVEECLALVERTSLIIVT